MSGTFPTDPAPNAVSLESNQPTIVTYAESGKSQARIAAGHLWRAKFSWSRLTREMMSPVFAFIMGQRGSLGNFQIVLPNYATPQGVATGTPLLSGAHTVGATSVVVDGWTASVTGILKAGDVLKCSSNSKVYMVTADCNSDAAGIATVSITPPLVADIADNDPVTVTNVPFTMSNDDDVMTWKGSAPNLAQYSLSMTESL